MAATAEEDVNMGTAIIPNLDSIAEFRILTSNFDAEYGEFSGGQINVITKSGSNVFHGDLFEFLRNTDLDARNYFSPTRGTFIQNQFGGTFGGPDPARTKSSFSPTIRAHGRRQGVDTGLIPVPSLADRDGNLSDLATSFYTTQILNGQSVVVPTTVSGPAWAHYLLSAISVIRFTPVNPTIFQVALTPTIRRPAPPLVFFLRCDSRPARGPRPPINLLQYIPAPNAAGNAFATSAYNQTLRDDKGSARIDANTRLGAGLRILFPR